MNNKLTRRHFIAGATAASASLLIARVSHAQDAIVSEDGPLATSMGYKADHTQVDTAKWTKKAGPDGADQQCTSCSLYQPIDDQYGGCPIFAGKRVHAAGWCNGWVPK